MIIYLFINPKKFFINSRNRNSILILTIFYLLLSLILIFFLKKILSSEGVFYGGIVQVLFNFIFLFFLALFLKVFLKIFGFERSLSLSISDSLNIFLPSYILFILIIFLNKDFVFNYSYSLIFLFTYKESFNFLNKTIFYLIYPPRALLFLYTILGIKYISELNFKKSILITFLIYFTFFIVYSI